MSRWILVVAGACILHCVAALAADRVTLDKPIYTEVFVRATTAAGRDEKVAGNLLSYDDQSITVKVLKGNRELRWQELTATSAFTLRSRLIDKTKAADWLTLGKFGWSMGARDQTHTALANAVRLDPSLKSQSDAILATPPGSGINQSTTQASTTAGANSNELIGAVGTTSGPRPSASLSRPKDYSTIKPTVQYLKSTPEQDAMAIAAAKAVATTDQKDLGVQFSTIETPHFLLFTDWDPREYEFLKTNLEEAYNAVSQQFEIPSKENVFVGKLPVYMFASFRDYAKYTDKLGFLGKPTTRSIRGYYEDSTKGTGKLIMYKPGADDVDEAEKEWAHVLVHEFTHAFVARYKTNARIPRWLNEGTAEVIAAGHFPFPGTYPYARQMAAEHNTADDLFDDQKMPTGEWYPVMQTMVEYLIAQDHTAFLKMFDAIKGGTDGEAALKKFYGLTDDGLFSAWRQAILHP